MTHGRVEEAEAELAKIEDTRVQASGQELEPVDDSQALELRPEKQYGYLIFLRLVFHEYPRRAILGATLMITQSFLYNAIFFTYALVLTKFYGVQRDQGAALRARVLGRQPARAAPARRRSSTRVGRKKMISGTYLHLGCAARGQRLALRQRRPDGDDADVRLGRHLLLRLGGRERRVPDRERDLADRDPGGGDRGLLRDRAGLRRDRAALLRLADRRRLRPRRALFIGYLVGGRDHGHRRHRRDRARDQRRGQIAGGHHEAAHVGSDDAEDPGGGSPLPAPAG